MKVSRKASVITSTLTLLTLLSVPIQVLAQGPASLFATAHGQGTLTVGKEEFKVTFVSMKLKEDGTGEITLVTDLQLFLTCAWSAGADLSDGINLKPTAGSTSSAQGAGKLFLRPDGKTIASLSMDGSSATKRKIQLKFVAD